MEKHKKIELLEKIKEKANSIYNKGLGAEFNAWEKQSEMILIKIFGENSKNVKDFREIDYSLLAFSLDTTEYEFIRACNMGLDTAKSLIDVYIENINLFEEDDEQKDSEGISINSKNNRVFIVHGRDDSTKFEVARFLEKLSLEPIILHEQVNGGKTIIEKIEEYTDVKYGIVIYTPCDIGGLNNDKKELKNRARQNVVFEHGFLIGKIGRCNVSALVKGDLETPNDISGVVYMNMDNGSWKIDLAKELDNAGYEIDFNKIYK